MDRQGRYENHQKLQAGLTTTGQSNVRPNYADYFHDTVIAKYRGDPVVSKSIIDGHNLKQNPKQTSSDSFGKNAPEVEQITEKGSGAPQDNGVSNRYPRVTDRLEFTSREHSRRMKSLSNKVQELVEILLAQTQRFHKAVGLLTRSLGQKLPEEPLVNGLKSAFDAMQKFLDDYTMVHLADLKDALRVILSVGSLPPKLPTEHRNGSLAAVVQMYEDRIAALEHSRRNELNCDIATLSRALGPMPRLITGEEVFSRAVHTIAGLKKTVVKEVERTSLGSHTEAVDAKTQRLLKLFRAVWARLENRVGKPQKNTAASRQKEADIEQELQAMRDAVTEAKEILMILEGGDPQ